jgi:hypothetical protein
MIELAAPLPVISTVSEIVICPEVKAIVPFRPDWKTISSSPAVLFASRMACRKLPAPESARLVTVNVVSRLRNSSDSVHDWFDLATRRRSEPEQR